MLTILFVIAALPLALFLGVGVIMAFNSALAKGQTR